MNTITIRNLYKYGGAVWAIIYLLMGLAEAGSLTGAIQVVVDVYIMKLFGWPWDEIILADTVWGLVRSHFQTWVVGWLVATIKYGLNS